MTTSIRKTLSTIKRASPQLHKAIWNDYYAYHLEDQPSWPILSGHCYIGYEGIIFGQQIRISTAQFRKMHWLHLLGLAKSPRGCRYQVSAPIIGSRAPFYLEALLRIAVRSLTKPSQPTTLVGI